MKSKALVIALALLAIGGCGQPFPTFALVDGPRILTTIVTPLVAAPGLTVQLRSVLIGSAVPAQAQWWRVCVPVAGDPSPVQTCFDGNGLVAATRLEGRSPTWTIPTDADTLAPWIGAGLGFDGSQTALLAMLQARGLDFLAVTELTTQTGATLRASKRFVMSIGALPMPVEAGLPPFAFGANTVQRDPMNSERCVSATGGELTVPLRATINATPGAAMGTSFALLADGGRFDGYDDHATLTPWHAPSEPGTVNLWLLAWRPLSRSGAATADDVEFCAFTVRAQ